MVYVNMYVSGLMVNLDCLHHWIWNLVRDAPISRSMRPFPVRIKRKQKTLLQNGQLLSASFPDIMSCEEEHILACLDLLLYSTPLLLVLLLFPFFCWHLNSNSFPFSLKVLKFPLWFLGWSIVHSRVCCLDSKYFCGSCSFSCWFQVLLHYDLIENKEFSFSLSVSLSYFLKFDLCPVTWSFLERVPWAVEKNVYSLSVGGIFCIYLLSPVDS